jgi:predicted GH43/DUF377 family glycosyl hydrolase
VSASSRFSKQPIQPESSQPTRRSFLQVAGASVALLSAGPLAPAQQAPTSTNPQRADGTFAWQFPSPDRKKQWEEYSFSIDRWWGDFPKDLPDQMDMFADNPWAIGPFTKYASNPVLAPTPGAWDRGHFGGGVHNGSIIVKDNVFYYIYRGERDIDIPKLTDVDYICDIGVATSTDGIHFKKDTEHSPFFRKGDARKYSYEDVNIVLHEGTYYLFCNQWLWGKTEDNTQNGMFLATSTDLLNWKKVGILFPDAKRTHRNGVVLQNPHNEAVRVKGNFVMYLDDGLVAYSKDLLHWESHPNPTHLPGGETCFALADYDPAHPDDMILFTGGAHTGHFYGIGEVHLSKADPEKPLGYLPRSALFAEKKYPFENGFAAAAPHEPISYYADCIFFNALTQHNGKWWVYYGGSEYYTSLATAPVRHNKTA